MAAVEQLERGRPTDFREYIRHTVQQALETVREHQNNPGTIVVPADADLSSFDVDLDFTRARRTLERWGGAVDAQGRLISPEKAKKAFAEEIADLNQRIASEQQAAEQDHAAGLLQEEMDFATQQLTAIAEQKEVTSGVATRVYQRALSGARTDYATTKRASAEANMPLFRKDLAHYEELAKQIPDVPDALPAPAA